MADTLQPAALQLYAAEVGKAIAKTEANIAELRRQRDQLQGTRDLVAELPKRLTHDVMVPFGRHAFFPGHLRQTNELLVELGAQYHVQCTAHHAEQVLQRRVQRVADGIRACEQQLQNHRARLQLSSEALGSSDATDEMEIRQSYDESEALLASVHAQPKKQARSQATTPLSQPGTSTSPDPDLDRLFAHMDKLALLEAADEADEAEASAADSSQEPSPAAAVSSAPGLTPALGTDPLSYSLADSDDDDDTMPAQQPRHGWLQPEEAAGGDVTQLAGHAAGPRPVAAAIDEGQQVGGSPAAHQEQLQGPSQPRQAMGQGQPTEPDLATRMQPMAAGRSAPGGGSGRQISKFKQQQLAARGAL
ncbi:Prefoldin subunit-domain-containing protein [Haematococcus lacustris]